MGLHTYMRNHLHLLMKHRMAYNDAKPLDGRAGWVAELGPRSGSINRVNRGLKPWAGVGDSGAVQRLTARIGSHM